MWTHETRVTHSHFGSPQFCRLLLRLKVFRSVLFKYLHDSNGEYSDAARDFHKLLEIFQKVSRNFLKRRSKVAQKRIKSDVQEISTIEWEELKNRFPSFVIHK